MIISNIKKTFRSGSFKLNVATMFSGTVVSQAIYLLFYPILTRIYSPINFGQYAIFMTFLSILTVLSTGQYELAILLSKKKINVKLIIYGIIVLSFISSITITILLSLIFPILQKYNLINSFNLIYIIGISIFINSLYQIGFQLSIRFKNFKSISVINIINVSTSILFQFLLSKTPLKDIGLIIGYIVGTLVAVIFFYIKNKKIFLIKNTKRFILNIKKQLSRYKRFPIFNLPATLVNLSANQAPNILLNSFGQNILGYFSLSQRVLGSPINLFSSSITHVFKERASSDYRKTGSCRDIFIKTFKSLFFISFIPFILIYILSPKIVPIIFGSEWKMAGIYIRALTIMYFFRFTVSPLTYVIIIAEKQNLNLILQSSLLISSVLSIGFGIINNNPLLSIKLFSISYSLMYIMFFTFSYKLSKS